jgi:hypothetical protein
VAKTLFSVPGIETRRSYAVSSDGRRFLIAPPQPQTTAEPITVVVNWAAGLRK